MISDIIVQNAGDDILSEKADASSGKTTVMQSKHQESPNISSAHERSVREEPQTTPHVVDDDNNNEVLRETGDMGALGDTPVTTGEGAAVRPRTAPGVSSRDLYGEPVEQSSPSVRPRTARPRSRRGRSSPASVRTGCSLPGPSPNLPPSFHRTHSIRSESASHNLAYTTRLIVASSLNTLTPPGLDPRPSIERVIDSSSNPSSDNDTPSAPSPGLFSPVAVDSIEDLLSQSGDSETFASWSRIKRQIPEVSHDVEAAKMRRKQAKLLDRISESEEAHGQVRQWLASVSDEQPDIHEEYVAHCGDGMVGAVAVGSDSESELDDNHVFDCDEDDDIFGSSSATSSVPSSAGLSRPVNDHAAPASVRSPLVQVIESSPAPSNMPPSPRENLALDFTGTAPSHGRSVSEPAQVLGVPSHELPWNRQGPVSPTSSIHSMHCVPERLRRSSTYSYAQPLINAAAEEICTLLEIHDSESSSSPAQAQGAVGGEGTGSSSMSHLDQAQLDLIVEKLNTIAASLDLNSDGGIGGEVSQEHLAHVAMMASANLRINETRRLTYSAFRASAQYFLDKLNLSDGWTAVAALLYYHRYVGFLACRIPAGLDNLDFHFFIDYGVRILLDLLGHFIAEHGGWSLRRLDLSLTNAVQEVVATLQPPGSDIANYAIFATVGVIAIYNIFKQFF